MIVMKKRCLALILPALASVAGGAARPGPANQGAKPPRIVYKDPTTWPAAPPGYVRSFSIQAHQRQIGFSLTDRLALSRKVQWTWSANGFGGQIRVSVWPTPREAHIWLASMLTLSSLVPKGLSAPGGGVVGDISWWLDDVLYFSRRNVAIRIQLRQKGPDAARELARVSKAIVAAIDSEELVKSPAQVKCPEFDVELPETLRPRDRGRIRIVARETEGRELRYRCVARPRRSGAVKRGPASADPGVATYTLLAGEPGALVVTVYVTDQDGMTRKAVKTVQILGQPTGGAPTPADTRPCRQCRRRVPHNTAKCPHCGSISQNKK